MNKVEIVKSMLGITGTYQDVTIGFYIDEIKQFMLSAGITQEIIDSDISNGLIARGVADLWNYGNGAGKLSPYFHNRLIQLCYQLNSKTPLPFNYLNKVTDYLYAVECNALTEDDYNFANEFFKRSSGVGTFGCTTKAMLRDNHVKLCRNFDYNYDDTCDFVVRTLGTVDKRSTIGISSGLALTSSIVDSKEYTDLYKILPFCIVDGFNRSMSASVMLVPADKGITTGTVPVKEVKRELCTSMLIRFVLDNFMSVSEACKYLHNYVSIYADKHLLALGYDSHFLLTDITGKCAIIEFVENELKFTYYDLVDNDLVLSNFFVDGLADNIQAVDTVPTPEYHDTSLTDYGFTLNCSGIERFNLAKSTDDMGKIYYSNVYDLNAEIKPYSDLVGIQGLNINSSLDEFKRVHNEVCEAYKQRKRDGKFWFTKHSCEYDLNNCVLQLKVQERDEVFNYGL